jgi:hypothetical protein
MTPRPSVTRSDSSAGPLVDGVDQGKPTGESTIGEGSQEELP